MREQGPVDDEVRLRQVARSGFIRGEARGELRTRGQLEAANFASRGGERGVFAQRVALISAERGAAQRGVLFRPPVKKSVGVGERDLDLEEDFDVAARGDRRAVWAGERGHEKV